MAQKERMERYHAIINKCLKLSTTIVEIIKENVQLIKLNDGDSLTISKCNLTKLLRQEKIYSELQEISEMFKDISDDYEENMWYSNRLDSNTKFNLLNGNAIDHYIKTQNVALDLKHYDSPQITEYVPNEIVDKDYEATVDDLGNIKSILYIAEEERYIVAVKQYTPYELLLLLNEISTYCNNTISKNETD